MLSASMGPRPLFLASVTDAGEALGALGAGADIIDCKAPDRGALGALPPATVRSIVAALPASATISATIGDLAADPGCMVPAAEAMAATGVGIVKIGFFGDRDASDAVRALGAAKLANARLYAVLMADRRLDLSLLPELTAQRFLGVMLDTADKGAGALPDVLAPDALEQFVRRAHGMGLVVGLAGALRVPHIDGLARLQPDILGFRGALCDGGRTGRLTVDRVAAVRAALDRAREDQRIRERSVA